MSHIYVCHFSNGAIKVGRAVNPGRRIASHAARVSCVGVDLLGSKSFLCVGKARVLEAELILRCAECADSQRGHEWFFGLNFDEVCSWAEEISHRERSSRAGCMDSNQLIDLLGGTCEVARIAEVKQPSVSSWRKLGIPSDKRTLLAVEAEKRGLATREEIRPDDFWRIWPDLPAPAAVEAKP